MNKRNRRLLTKDEYRSIEKHVRKYYLYILEINNVRYDIIHATPIFDNIGGGRSNLPSRPTEKITMNLLENEEKMKEKIDMVNAVTAVLGQLSEEQQRFIHTLYWSGRRRSFHEICRDFNIGKSTFYRWKLGFLSSVWSVLYS